MEAADRDGDSAVRVGVGRTAMLDGGKAVEVVDKQPIVAPHFKRVVAVRWPPAYDPCQS